MTQNFVFKFHVLSAGLEPDKVFDKESINKSDFFKIEIVSWKLEGYVGMLGICV